MLPINSAVEVYVFAVSVCAWTSFGCVCLEMHVCAL